MKRINPTSLSTISSKVIATYNNKYSIIQDLNKKNVYYIETTYCFKKYAIDIDFEHSFQVSIKSGKMIIFDSIIDIMKILDRIAYKPIIVFK